MGARRFLLPCFAALALAAAPAQPKPVYRWKDDKGNVQITNTPPPPGAEVLDGSPPPLAVETDRGEGRLVMRQSGGAARQQPADLSPTQRAAWEELDKHLEEARKRGDKRVLEAVASSLLHDSLWGSGLGWVALIPFVTLALMALAGWWLSFEVKARHRLQLIAGFTLAGVLAAQVLVGHFLYRPQFFRVRLNLTLFTNHYLGAPRQITPQEQERLGKHFRALEAATSPFNAPWRFYSEVGDLEDTLKQVVAAS